MSPRRRTGRKLLVSLLPIILVVALALAGLTVWLVYGATHPPRRAYLVTPERFVQLSDRGLKATEETWSNRDGTSARGWLVRGAEGLPAVVLLHRYGADRSWLLNLGVKLNETTNYTVLWPDLRGHGVDPPVAWTSFGGREADDVGAAIDYLHSLKAQDRPLVGNSIGIYGVEVGAYAALRAGTRDPKVRALVLDSIPASPNDILNDAVKERTGTDSGLCKWLASLGIRIYFLGSYYKNPSC